MARLIRTAIAQVQAEAWPDVRDADELHDVLHTLVAVPESSSQLSALGSQSKSQSQFRSPENQLPYLVCWHCLPAVMICWCARTCGSQLDAADWQIFFERLLAERRAFVAEDAGRKYWVAAERADLFAAHASWRDAVEAACEALTAIAEDAAGRELHALSSPIRSTGCRAGMDDASWANDRVGDR